MTHPFLIDSSHTDDYPSDLYRFHHLADYVESSADVTAEHITRFNETGYLAVRRLIDQDDIQEALAGLAAILESPRGATIQYESWAPANRITSGTGAERMDMVRRFMGFVKSDERLRRLATDNRVIEIVRRLCGATDLTLFQDMALLKPPGGGREKPWHQDNAFFNYEPGTPIIGVWIASTGPPQKTVACTSCRIPIERVLGSISSDATGSCATRTSTFLATLSSHYPRAARCFFTD